MIILAVSLGVILNPLNTTMITVALHGHRVSDQKALFRGSINVNEGR